MPIEFMGLQREAKRFYGLSTAERECARLQDCSLRVVTGSETLSQREAETFRNALDRRSTSSRWRVRPCARRPLLGRYAEPDVIGQRREIVPFDLMGIAAAVATQRVDELRRFRLRERFAAGQKPSDTRPRPRAPSRRPRRRLRRTLLRSRCRRNRRRDCSRPAARRLLAVPVQSPSP